jgi:hypothetical protein
MAGCFLDSGAVAKFYHEEAGSAAVEQVVQDSAASILISRQRGSTGFNKPAATGPPKYVAPATLKNIGDQVVKSAPNQTNVRCHCQSPIHKFWSRTMRSDSLGKTSGGSQWRLSSGYQPCEISGLQIVKSPVRIESRSVGTPR